MVTPIRALTRGAQRVAEGDFGHEIQVESHDEIGVLTNAFNAMSASSSPPCRRWRASGPSSPPSSST